MIIMVARDLLSKLFSLAQFFLNLYLNLARSFFVCSDCCYLAFVSKNFSDAEILSVGKILQCCLISTPYPDF